MKLTLRCCLFLLPAAFALPAAGTLGPTPLMGPAISTARGTFTAVFTQACQAASIPSLERRFGTHLGDRAEGYSITNESFILHIPTSYVPDSSWGLFVATDPSGIGTPIPEWLPELARHRLVWIAPVNSGNERNWLTRVRLTIEAAYGGTRHLSIDPNRLFVAGISGGGRISSISALLYADIFAGGYYMVGCDYSRTIASIQYTNSAYRAIFPAPSGKVLTKARNTNRYVFLTGETDGNRDQTFVTYRDGYGKDGFRHTLYLEVPGMGHSIPPVEWFIKGLEFLDPPASNAVPVKAAAPSASGAR